MNREEFANKWAAVEIYEDGLPISIVIQARYNDLLADLDSLSLPPAEGAEEMLKQLNEDLEREFPTDLAVLCKIHNIPIRFDYEQGERLSEYQYNNKLRHEGARWAISHTTLHAQRIADKMASERLNDIEFLLVRASGLVGNPGTNISGSCDVTCDNWQRDYEEYLKTRDSHESV